MPAIPPRAPPPPSRPTFTSFCARAPPAPARAQLRRGRRRRRGLRRGRRRLLRLRWRRGVSLLHFLERRSAALDERTVGRAAEGAGAGEPRLEFAHVARLLRRRVGRLLVRPRCRDDVVGRPRLPPEFWRHARGLRRRAVVAAPRVQQLLRQLRAPHPASPPPPRSACGCSAPSAAAADPNPRLVGAGAGAGARTGALTGARTGAGAGASGAAPARARVRAPPRCGRRRRGRRVGGGREEVGGEFGGRHLRDDAVEERAAEEGGGRRALCRRGGEEVGDGAAERARVRRRQRRVVAADDFHGEAVHVARVKRVAECGEFVEDAAEGPHVRLVRVPLLPHELGAHVERRADARLREVGRLVEDARDAEVTELDRVVVHQEDVLRLDVAVDHTVALVDVHQREAQLREPLDDVRLRDLLPPLLVRLDPRVQVAARAERHHDAELVGRLVDERVVVRADVRVAQLLQQLRLLERRLPLALVARQLDLLHDPRPPRRALAHEEDGAEAALAEGFDLFVALHCGRIDAVHAVQ